MRILIADDDDGDRKQIRRTLNQAGFVCDVVEARSTSEAVTACEADTFDCALIDYLMPGESGLEGAAVLHERWPFMAIIMITGQGDEKVASAAIKSGAADYTPKDALDAGAIRRIVDNALEKTALQRKLAEQQEDLTNFAAVLVHDLRSPLRRISNFAELIKEAIEDGDLEAINKDCDRIALAAKRMNELLETVHAYTGADQAVGFEPVPLDEALNQALDNLHAAIKERGAEVTRDPLPVFWGNAALLTQLLQNLIANGIKYCEAQIPTIHVSAKEMNGMWRMSVRDNGIGIPADKRNQIFIPFERLHSDEMHYAGTGLGLATCRKIAHRLGGKIWCDAVDGGGTVFIMSVPAWGATKAA